MIAAALACIGVKISKNAWTGNLVPLCRATGKFTFHTDAKYLTSDKYLKTGDIVLNTAAHVITALEDGEAAKKKNGQKNLKVNMPANSRSFRRKGAYREATLAAT